MDKPEHSFGFPSSELLSGEIPRWEFHVHTHYTDGKDSVDEIVKTAIEKGISTLAFTEHTEPWQSKDPDWFKKYKLDIEKAIDQYGSAIKLLIGIEAPLLSFDGSLDCTNEMLDGSDFILGAAHRYPGMEGRRMRDLSPEEALELEYKTLEVLCKVSEIDCIAHIGATCMKYCGPFPLSLTKEIGSLAKHHGKAIEVNHVYHKPLDDYLSLFMELEVPLLPGSNAHKKENIGSVIDAINAWKNEQD